MDALGRVLDQSLVLSELDQFWYCRFRLWLIKFEAPSFLSGIGRNKVHNDTPWCRNLPGVASTKPMGVSDFKQWFLVSWFHRSLCLPGGFLDRTVQVWGWRPGLKPYYFFHWGAFSFDVLISFGFHFFLLVGVYFGFPTGYFGESILNPRIKSH